MPKKTILGGALNTPPLQKKIQCLPGLAGGVGKLSPIGGRMEAQAGEKETNNTWEILVLVLFICVTSNCTVSYVQSY